MTYNFTITDKAKKKIENLLEKESINKFFRIEVKVVVVLVINIISQQIIK